jgi:uncharacterized protein DUF397
VTQPAKPTVEELRVDPGALAWQRSTEGAGAIEVAFVRAGGEEWVLMRLSGDSDGRVSVFSRFEWDCFLDGVKNGEFDDAASKIPEFPGVRQPGIGRSGGLVIGLGANEPPASSEVRALRPGI